MTKMQLKVTVVTFATPQLEKIPRLTAFPTFLQNSSTLQQFFHPPVLGVFGKVFPSPHSKEGGGGGGGGGGRTMQIHGYKMF